MNLRRFAFPVQIGELNDSKARFRMLPIRNDPTETAGRNLQKADPVLRTPAEDRTPVAFCHLHNLRILNQAEQQYPILFFRRPQQHFPACDADFLLHLFHSRSRLLLPG
jgi:hypothetical protein